MMKSRPRANRSADIAVYAPFAGTLYAGGAQAIGGAELQSGWIARSLAAHGFRVRHVVFGENLLDRVDGVEVIPIPPAYGRRRFARRRAVIEAVRRADAKLYIQRSAGFETGVVGAYARLTRSRFVFSSSGDADFSRDPFYAKQIDSSLDEWPTRLQYLLGLRLAEVVVAQTESQSSLARQERGVTARVIPSFCEAVDTTPRVRDEFLWIGALVGVKNPLAYLELAQQMPEARFRMIATGRGPAWAEFARSIRDRAAALPNLELHGPVGRQELLGVYGQAVAVVNTSWFEGFPNVFLEAWARRTPALSLRVDPDKVIERNNLGAACEGSAANFVVAARHLWETRDSNDRQHLSDYIKRVHDPAIVARKWIALVEELIEH